MTWDLPGFLSGVRSIQAVDLNAQRFLPHLPQQSAMPPAEYGDSAVLILVCGQQLSDARIILEERAHTMRSQPAQFSLPGGRKDPGDATMVQTALREAHEEIGLDARILTVVGQCVPVTMPFRRTVVTPILSWTPYTAAELFDGLLLSKSEVERVIAPRLVGPGSLCDPDVLTGARVGAQDVGLAFDLPRTVMSLWPRKSATAGELSEPEQHHDAFVWGFTAGIVAGFLSCLMPEFPPKVFRSAKNVPNSRLLGERSSAEGR